MGFWHDDDEFGVENYWEILLAKGLVVGLKKRSLATGILL